MISPDGRVIIEYETESELALGDSGSSEKTSPVVAALGGASLCALVEGVGYLIYEIPKADKVQNQAIQLSQDPQAQPLNTYPTYNNHFGAEVGLLAISGLIGAVTFAGATAMGRRALGRFRAHRMHLEARKILDNVHRAHTSPTED